MPLCPVLWSALSCRYRPPGLSCSLRWQTNLRYALRLRQSYSTALDENRHNEAAQPEDLNLATASAESKYLDFILGPSDRRRQDEKLDTLAYQPKQALPKSRQLAKGGNRPPGGSRVKTRYNHGDGETMPLPPKEDNELEHGLLEETLPRRGLRRARGSAGREHTRSAAAEKAVYLIKARAMMSHQRDRKQGHHIRTKHVHIRSGGAFAGHFSTWWNTKFAKLHFPYENCFSRNRNRNRAPPQLPAEVASWAEEVLNISGAPMEKSSSAALHALRNDTRRWKSIALWILYHEPGRMVDFLRLTHAIKPPTICVEDSLKHLGAYFSTLGEAEKLAQFRRLIDVFPVLADRPDSARLSIESDLLHRMLPYCSDSEVNQLYKTIKVHHVKVLPYTLLHFATYFARHEQFEKALDAVLEAKAAGADPKSFAFLSNCSTLLRRSIRMPGGFRVCLRLIDNLVKIGLKLNTQLCNIVMLNAVEAGDFKTALSVYHSLVEYGLDADHYTYAILLRGCKINIDDVDTLNALIRSAISHVRVLQEGYLSTEILHCLALHHTKHNPAKAYTIVADAYANLFDVKPLENFGLPMTDKSSLDTSGEQKMQPSAAALGIMLRVYLYDNYVNKSSVSGAYSLYRRFRKLVQEGQEPFLSLASSDYLANAFLVSFIRTKQGLLHAAEVVKDMQQPLDKSLGAEQCKPTQQTWSIFLHGFTRHKQMKLAEQVLKYMQSKGIEPNQVTWNTLVAGYAAEQDTDALLDVLRRLEAGGAVWNDATMKNLRRFHNQDMLRKEYQRKGSTAASYDFTKDLKEGLEKRLSSNDPVDVEERKQVLEES